MKGDNVLHKKAKLRENLEYAVDQGVRIFMGGQLSSPEEIAYGQCVREEGEYLPEFIVIDEGGKVTEIWYSDATIE